MHLSVSEKSKRIVIIIDGFKFRFHKILTNDVPRWRSCCLKSRKSYFKYENNFYTLDQPKER